MLVILLLLNSVFIDRVHASTLLKSHNITAYSFPKLNNLSNIYDIEQDQHGFLWLATNKGLFRFNGYDLKQYGHGSKPENSLPPFTTYRLLIDQEQHMWVGTSGGLSIYHSSTNRFERIWLKHKSTITNIITLFEDSQNNIWVGTYQHGAFKISNDLTTIEQFSAESATSSKLADNFVRSINEDNQGNIWITTDSSLNQYKPKGNTIATYPVEATGQGSIVQPNGQLLVSTDKGLLNFDQNTQSFSNYQNNRLAAIDSPITTLAYSPTNELVVGTRSSGLALVDSAKKHLLRYQKNQSSQNSLSSEGVKSLFFDRDKNLWVGTNNGLNKITFTTPNIELYRQEYNLEKCLSGNDIYAIYLDSRDILWVGVKGKGLHRIDRKNNHCQLFNSLNIELEGLSLDFIFDIKEDSNGTIWIANHDEGLVKLNPDSLTFSRAQVDKPEHNELLSNAFVFQLSIDEKDNIWLAMDKIALAKLNTNTRTLELIGEKVMDELGIKSLRAQTLQQSQGKIWLGTTLHGLISIDKKTTKLKQYIRENQDKEGIAEFIYTSKLDRHGYLWIGSKAHGLYKFNTTTAEIENFRVSEGLADNSVWNIQIDSNNKVWASTGNGLSVLDQDSNTFTNFFESDGLQSNGTPPAGFYDSKKEEYWTGGGNGFNKINTRSIPKKKTGSDVLVTGFKIDYEPVEISTPKVITPLLKNILDTDTIELRHDQNNFSFSFATINFNDISRVRYQYQLENYDDWKLVDTYFRQANYTNISSGEYVFRVRASDDNGNWSSKNTAIRLFISPPWWQTTTAYIIYVVSFLLSLYLLIAYRTRALQQRAIKLEQSVSERTIELAEEKQKVELLLSRKNEEFANVSHEFRTPLTLILGPIAQLLKNKNNEQQNSRLNVVQRNGYRLLRMVDQLLNLETFRIKAITQKSPQNTYKTIKLLTDAFKDLAEEKGIQLTIGCLAEANFEFTSDALEKVILNLLSNAIKYTKSGGNITIESTRTNLELTIKVSDSGIGIPADKLESIFDRYNRVLDENSEQVTGAGIGLALVKNLVQAHQGEISAESILGEGTTITVTLPIIGEIDAEQIGPHNNDEIIAMELMSLTHQPNNEIQNTNTPTQTENNQQPSVLVIEDNADMRDYIVNSINSDFQIFIARDGEEGVKTAISEVPDLIISDVMMPKKDGYQVTEALRSNTITNHIPIILLTARGDRESRLKGWHQKADEYLTKPFDVEELKIRLNNLLEIRNILKKRFAVIAFTPQKEIDTTQEVLTPLDTSSDLDKDKGKLDQQEKFLVQLNLVLEKLYNDSETSITLIAEANHMSLRQLFRKIKSVLDMTPAEYLRRFRLEKARTLLESGESASFAAFEVGFSSHSYFGKCFKAQFGVSPSEYKVK